MSITAIEKVLYTAKAHTTGGRDGGASRTCDGRLDVKFSVPGTPPAPAPTQSSCSPVGWVEGGWYLMDTRSQINLTLFACDDRYSRASWGRREHE
jgi:hypothetical protein